MIADKIRLELATTHECLDQATELQRTLQQKIDQLETERTKILDEKRFTKEQVCLQLILHPLLLVCLNLE